MLVAVMAVATGGVRLPDLDEAVADRPAVGVQHPPGDDDPLAERLAAVWTVRSMSVRPTRPGPSSGPVSSVSDCGRRTSGFVGARSRVAA